MLAPADLKKALVAIQKSRPLPSQHPLLALQLIQHRLAKTDAKGDYVTLVTAFEVITETFEEKLGQVLIHSKPNQEELCKYFRTYNAYQQTYCLLYFYYIRRDLAMTVDDMAGKVGYCKRSIERWMADGINHMTVDLTTRELNFRRVTMFCDRCSCQGRN